MASAALGLLGCAQLAGLGDFSDDGGVGGSSTSGGGGALGGGSAGAGNVGAGNVGAGNVGAGNVGAMGGSGATGPCGASGEVNDDNNCGACDHSCDGGTCDDKGICSPVEINLSNQLGPVAVVGNNVYVTRGQNLLVLKDDESSPALADVVPNSDFGTRTNTVAVMSAGTMNVFVAPQHTSSGSAVLMICNTAGCQTDTRDVGGAHFNAIIRDNGRLILLTSNSDNQIYELEMSAQETPEGQLALFTKGGFGGLVSDGLHQAYLDNGHVFVSGFGDGACVYDLNLLIKPSSAVPCLGNFTADIQGSYAGDGRIFVHTLNHTIFSIDPGGIATPWAEGAGPIRAGEEDVYVGAVGGGITVLDSVGDPVVTFPAEGDSVQSIDASHPDYVFYTAGSSLFRWRKRP